MINFKTREITAEYQIFYYKFSEKLIVSGVIWAACILSTLGILFFASDGTFIKVLFCLMMTAIGIIPIFWLLARGKSYIKITKDKLIYKLGNADEQSISINEIESIGTEWHFDAYKPMLFIVTKKHKEKVYLPLTGYEEQIIDLLDIHTKFEPSFFVSDYVFLIIPAAVVIIAILVIAMNSFHF